MKTEYCSVSVRSRSIEMVFVSTISVSVAFFYFQRRERVYSMFNIAICDDDKNNLILMSNSMKDFCKRNPTPMRIRYFRSGEDLLSAIENGFYFDLIYLKVEMGKYNGIKIGRYIRNQLNDFITQLVFISHYSHYALQLFSIQAMDFILEPIQSERIIETLRSAFQVCPHKQPHFSFTNHKVLKNIPYRSIVYFESDNRKIHLYHINGIDMFYGRLDDVEKELEQLNFLRIHQSYLVNYLHVIKMDPDHVYLDTGAILPISRSRQKALREEILKME